MTSVRQDSRRPASKSPRAEPTAGTADDRKEKKRASDRLAQREHRRRQREYIDELEAQLKMIKEGSHSESVAALVSENERLKSELKQLRDFATTVNLAMAQLQTTAAKSLPVSPAPAGSGVARPSAGVDLPKTAYGEMAPKNDLRLDGATPADVLENSHMVASFPLPRSASPGGDGQCSIRQGAHEPILDFDASTEILQDHHLVDPMPHHANGNMPIVHRGEDTNPANIFTPLLSRSAWERLGQLDIAILPDMYSKPLLPPETANPAHFSASKLLPSDDVLMEDPRTTQSEWPSHQPAAHKSIPNILFPALQDDETLYAMVDSARWQAVISETKIPKPDLVDCLLDSTANQFSQELKQYLEPMRQLRRNEEYFACYWLIATLIRWYVHQEETFYNNVPAWLRPTALELRIPHPLLISFMPWPLMRNQLILDFHIHRLPIHPIMADLGEFLETKLSCAAGGLAMGEEQLVQALNDLKNWRLKPGFFERHPQFRDAYRQYAV